MVKHIDRLLCPEEVGREHWKSVNTSIENAEGEYGINGGHKNEKQMIEKTQVELQQENNAWKERLREEREVGGWGREGGGGAGKCSTLFCDSKLFLLRSKYIVRGEVYCTCRHTHTAAVYVLSYTYCGSARAVIHILRQCTCCHTHTAAVYVLSYTYCGSARAVIHILRQCTCSHTHTAAVHV